MPILTQFTDQVADCKTPGAVLDRLNDLVSHYLPMSVLGAASIPLKLSDWRSVRLGEDVFLHSSAPQGWWDEYSAMAHTEYNPALMIARSSLMAFTWTETMQMLDPIGVDRWPFELSLKYGMRDAFICSVGRRWMVCYWSPKVLSNVLTQPLRIVLFAAASFAALRLQQVTEADTRSVDKRTAITPRELAVMRLVSLGKRSEDVAKLLGIGEETVRSHIKKMQTKLGVHNRTHAVAEAIRQHLIP
jgi:LuxR family quorum sensing-dependent transcriptional regulator